jgi:hypothetical protein
VGKQFDPALYTRTLQGAAADQPDFYMTIGDDFSLDALKEVDAETVRAFYLNQRQWLGLVGAPVFLVNGNHEQAALGNLDGSPDNVAVWAQTARNTYYPQPAPDAFYSGDSEPVEQIGLLHDYYAFTWGDALFVLFDPYWHSPQPVDNQFGAERGQKQDRDLWQITLGEIQYQWFRHTLETSGARYKFVFAHHVNGTGRGGVETAPTASTRSAPAGASPSTNSSWSTTSARSSTGRPRVCETRPGRNRVPGSPPAEHDRRPLHGHGQRLRLHARRGAGQRRSPPRERRARAGHGSLRPGRAARRCAVRSAE